MSDQKRPYRMRRRAELEELTRRRITESAVELHEELGPARTSIAAIAERAGRTPLDGLPPLSNRGRALRRLLVALARREPAARPVRLGHDRGPRGANEQRASRPVRLLRTHAGHVFEFAPGRVSRPAGAPPATRLLSLPGHDRGCPHGRPRPARAGGTRTRAAIGHALAFTTWRSLTDEQGLGDTDAVALMCLLVETGRTFRRFLAGVQLPLSRGW